MARVTVEDCIDKVDSPYELVLVAKERAVQLNSGLEPTLDRDNDKNTVISLREIAEGTIQVSDLTDSAVHKLRKHVEQVDDGEELGPRGRIVFRAILINEQFGVGEFGPRQLKRGDDPVPAGRAVAAEGFLEG